MRGARLTLAGAARERIGRVGAKNVRGGVRGAQRVGRVIEALFVAQSEQAPRGHRAKRRAPQAQRGDAGGRRRTRRKRRRCALHSGARGCEGSSERAAARERLSAVTLPRPLDDSHSRRRVVEERSKVCERGCAHARTGAAQEAGQGRRRLARLRRAPPRAGGLCPSLCAHRAACLCGAPLLATLLGGSARTRARTRPRAHRSLLCPRSTTATSFIIN